MLKIDGTTPGTFLKIISHKDDVGRKSESVITQLRTSHVRLNSYLKRIRKINSSRCPGGNTEDLAHFLLASATPTRHGYSHRAPAELRCPSVPSWETRPSQSRWLTTLRRRTDSTRTVSNHMDRSTLVDNPPQCSYFRASTIALHPPSPCQLPSSEPSLRRQSAWQLLSQAKQRNTGGPPVALTHVCPPSRSDIQIPGLPTHKPCARCMLSGHWESSILAAGRDL
jgi:hypothetical protein